MKINVSEYKLEKELNLAAIELKKINNQLDSLSNERVLLIRSIKKLKKELKELKENNV